jgi:hypothetical protein|nr:hypothetical protein [Alteromonas macleodii]|tara:strand:- start:213 stop:845 length:633 start_codon:yes stop_codon:yes gene_type:complete
MEFLKLLLPLIGVMLGAWLIPYIERRKSNEEANKILKAFFIEIEDVKNDTEENIILLSDIYKKAVLLKRGLINDKEDFFPIKLPSKNTFLTYDLVLKNSLNITTPDLRKAFRAINSISDTINSAIDELPKETNAEEYRYFLIRELAEQCAIFYYLISRLHNEQERFQYLKIEDEEIINNVFNSLRAIFTEAGVVTAHNKHIKSVAGSLGQ